VLSRSTVALAVVMMLIGSLRPVADAQTTESTGDQPPAGANAGDSGADILQRSLNLSTGVLSTDERSASDRFVLRIRAKGADGTFSTTEVVRDKDDVAVVVRPGPSGLPYYFLRPGLLVMIDSSGSGQLKYLKQGAPEVVIEPTATGSLKWQPDCLTKQVKPHINIDFRGVLNASLSRARKITYDAKNATVTIRTPHATTEVVLSTASSHISPVQIERFSVKFDLGNEIVVESLPLKLGASALKVDFQAIQTTGVAMRSAAVEEISDGEMLSPSADFPQTETERQAGNALMSILPPIAQGETEHP
jgi:hypothetical protein